MFRALCILVLLSLLWTCFRTMPIDLYDEENHINLMEYLKNKYPSLEDNPHAPDFMKKMYREMQNVPHCDGRVIRSVPGKVLDEDDGTKRLKVLSFHILPFEKTEEETPYNAEIRVTNVTGPVQVAVWTTPPDSAESSSSIGNNRFRRDITVPLYDEVITVQDVDQDENLVVDLHATEIMGTLSDFQEGWEVILEIRFLGQLPSSLRENRNITSFFVVHSMRNTRICTQNEMYSSLPMIRDELMQRSKRSYALRKGKANDLDKTSFRLCHKRTYMIVFEYIGWNNWIIYPPYFYGNLCEGVCPFPLSERVNSTHHGIIQSLFHTLHKDVPPTCCAPAKLRPMPMIFYDYNNNIVLKQFDDMIIESCACQ